MCRGRDIEALCEQRLNIIKTENPCCRGYIAFNHNYPIRFGITSEITRGSQCLPRSPGWTTRKPIDARCSMSSTPSARRTRATNLALGACATHSRIHSSLAPRRSKHEHAISYLSRGFTKAKERRGSTQTDIIPYWVFPGSASIERHVPFLPLSRDRERLDALRRSLTLYRMVFGQNRQEDLLAYLLAHFTNEQAQDFAQHFRINLEPSSQKTHTSP